ncbi:MAG: flagellar basal body rod protein FlgC [Gammaproteobacteria bacterium]
MGLFNILDISAAGMDVQQARLEAASLNLANSNTSAAPGTQPYRPLEVVIHSVTSAQAPSFIGDAPTASVALPKPVVAQMTPTDAAPRLVYNPGHPDADGNGFVSLPGVDPISSMLDLISISRGYEANLRAFDVTRSLLQKTLDLGSHR